MMSNLIDRQAAIATAVRAALDWHRLANPMYSIAYCIGEAMRELPSVDAVEVVRCKDCANCEYDSIFNQYWCGGSEVISDGFCNYGEREDPLHGAMNPPEDDITEDKGEVK